MGGEAWLFQGVVGAGRWVALSLQKVDTWLSLTDSGVLGLEVDAFEQRC